MARIVVETDDLVTLSDVARRCDIGRSTVQMWADRPGDFPEPQIVTAGVRPVRLWSWAAVAAWLEKESS